MTEKKIPTQTQNLDYASLALEIKEWGKELGFQQVGICDTDLIEHESHLKQWLAKQFHGDMDYMANHGDKRSRPTELVPGTQRIIVVRMDYLSDNTLEQTLASTETAYISRYTLGRDYHKLIRKRLQLLAEKITQKAGLFGYRAFVDSAPVLEKALAEKAGLGWIGKHTLLLDKQLGSWFFLGELFTDLPLPVDTPSEKHCGTCSACIDVCPTQAIVAPYQLDSRRCISYLTIELKDAIPEHLRKAMGNRVFGCDDCQIVCPWNRFAPQSSEPDFAPRHGLEAAQLLELFLWDEATFLEKTAGMAIRRTGYRGWLRNLAVGLGNAPYSEHIMHALQNRLAECDDMVAEHIRWALQQQKHKQPR